MTIEILEFGSLEKANTEKKDRQGAWRSLHTDFVNKIVRVTFVNGTDDPDNSVEAEQDRIEFARSKVLREKLRNKNMSMPELLELLDKQL